MFKVFNTQLRELYFIPRHIKLGTRQYTAKTVNSSSQPTIYALSTKPGRSAIGVIRISGTGAKFVYRSLAKTTEEPKKRTASLRRLFAPDGMLLDNAITLFFNSPNTYTGEDILELHLHGGTAVCNAVLHAIKKLHNPENGHFIRYAENGEFSRRGFMNGRYDLTQIEGVREMIDAETETQRISALSSMNGDTKNYFMEWRREILNNVALLTTLIDFGEDHDVDEAHKIFDNVAQSISALSANMKEFLRRSEKSAVLLNGIKLTLLGPPNVGKSSILNYLAAKDAAIVSDIPGTTRDVIDIPLDIGGYKVVVGDTAGIRSLEDADSIESEGIKRAKSKSFASDLALAVLPLDKLHTEITEEFLNHLKDLREADVDVVLILNKVDLLKENEERGNIILKYSKLLNIKQENIFVVSCLNGYGMNELSDILVDRFKALSMSDNNQLPLALSDRVKDIIENDVLYGFEQFDNFRKQDDVVLATESLRGSIEGIGKITGEAIGIEEILGIVFSSFCIGK